MRLRKISQYEVERHQPTPIGALPKDAIPARDNGQIVEPLPDTPDEPEPLVDLVFENMHIGHHNDQDDYNLITRRKEDSQPLAAIEYTVHNDKIYINNIVVKEGFRRMGIGTALLRELQKLDDLKGMQINWGLMTDDGYALKESLGNAENNYWYKTAAALLTI